MSVFLANILDDEDLKIDSFRDDDESVYYVGTSDKYEPKKAISRTPLGCLFKFDIPVAEQQRLASKFR